MIEHMKARARSEPETASTRSKTAMPDDDHQPPEKTGSLVVFTNPKSRADDRGSALPEQGQGRREDGVGDVLGEGERVERDPQEGEDRLGGDGHLSGSPSGRSRSSA